jgi:hypothetical protein
MGALSRLWNLLKNFHAADISSLMNHLVFREKLIIFNILFEKDKEKTGEVLSELDPEDAAQILKELQLEQISELFHGRKTFRRCKGTSPLRGRNSWPNNVTRFLCPGSENECFRCRNSHAA